MPAIHLFQRRTLLGGDDLQFPALVTIAIRCFQLFCLVGICLWYIKKDSETAGGLSYYVLFGPRTQSSSTSVENGNDDSFENHPNYSSATVVSPPPETSSPSDLTVFPCKHKHVFPSLVVCYTFICSIFFPISIYIESRIYHWSCQGPPTQTNPRSKHVEELMEWKLLPMAISLALLSGMGVVTLSFVPSHYSCLPGETFWFGLVPHRHVLWHVCIVALILSQSIDAVLSLLYVAHLWFWDPYKLVSLVPPSERRPQHKLDQHHTQWSLPHHSDNATNDIHRFMHANSYTHCTLVHDHELIEEMWASRCSYFCRCLSFSTCFLFGGRELSHVSAVVNEKFGHVARVLADYLETRGVLDIVPSDVVTGLLVLQRTQQKRILYERLIAKNEHRRLLLLNPSSAEATLSSGLLTTSTVQQEHQPTNNRHDDKHENNAAGTNVQVESAYHNQNNEGNQTPPPQVEESGLQTPSVLNPNNKHDLFTLQEGAHFSRYALAIYTWILYLYVHPITGIPRILANCSSCKLSSFFCCTNKCISKQKWQKHYNHDRDCIGNRERDPEPDHDYHGDKNDTSLPYNDDENIGENRDPNFDHTIIGDDICEAHKTALLLTAELEESDLIYAQLKSSFTENPYCILLDHNWKCVVVAIRGTFSLEDCLTDTLMAPESLEALGEEFHFDGTGQYCHAGVLECVKNVYRDLQRHKLLDKLLLNENSLYRDYDLRFVGHSLGASTATVLSFMLREKFPTVRCINYAPPGCSLTWEMAVQCQKWCVSFALDSDVVPRLSKTSLWKLRDEMLELIGRIKVPKIEVAQRLVVDANNNRGRNEGRLEGLPPSNSLSNSSHMCDIDLRPETEPSEVDNVIEDILYNHGEENENITETNYYKQLQQFKLIQEQLIQARGDTESNKLFPPGRFVRIVKTGEDQSCLHDVAKCLTCWTTNAGFQYTPMYVKNDHLDEIIITPTMGTDHFPNRIRFELETLASEYGLDDMPILQLD